MSQTFLMFLSIIMLFATILLDFARGYRLQTLFWKIYPWAPIKWSVVLFAKSRQYVFQCKYFH